MPRPLHRHLVALAIVALIPAALAAQREPPHDPIFWPAGELWRLRADGELGYGWVFGDWCERCAARQTRGVAGRFGLGLPVHPQLVLGWEHTTHWRSSWWWYYPRDHTAPRMAMRAGYVRWYPSAFHTFSLQAHVGRTWYDWEAGFREGWEHDRRVRLKGWGFGIGAAYDSWPGALSHAGLAPVVSLWHVPSVRGGITTAQTARVPYRASYTTLRLGVGLTVR